MEHRNHLEVGMPISNNNSFACRYMTFLCNPLPISKMGIIYKVDKGGEKFIAQLEVALSCLRGALSLSIIFLAYKKQGK